MRVKCQVIKRTNKIKALSTVFLGLVQYGTFISLSDTAPQPGNGDAIVPISQNAFTSLWLETRCCVFLLTQFKPWYAETINTN